MRFRLVLVLLLMPVLSTAQLTTGIVEGVVHGAGGEPVKHLLLTAVDGNGFRIAMETNSDGRFTFSAPYGQYTVSSNSQPPQATAVTVSLEPLRTVSLDLVIDSSGRVHRWGTESDAQGRSTSNNDVWLGATHGTTPPLGFSLQSIVGGEEPASISVPSDFTGLADNRLALISERAFSWTTTQ